ncbi:3-oxoadipate enol-lactonase [Pontibaca salina]|uniref:3-oxoadipate enol-lactonase n=1 Tax=Pontibaca salina TaxID=2795731 RepID=A0A934HS31_9RHOB|nr:3-oxoadipate enol-lactonase [Pontibaca salina]MBI6629520.1 3-oxoadipate enol-lactonase [Pontibaca salina]
MQIADLGNVQLHYRIDGDSDGAPVVFANALGTDLHIWDAVLPLLPEGLRFIRYDTRGHGRSSVPAAPYSMGALVRDAEMLLDHLNVRDCVFVGLSLGGMIAQGLAVKRLDQVRALVLSNTAAKIGTAKMWQERVDAINSNGIASLAEAEMGRWFSPNFRARPELALWRSRLLQQPEAGYAGCCAAIAGTDFYTPTSGLRLPVLGIAGDRDAATPPDLVRETIELVPGAQFQLIRKAGHLACVEQPEAFAKVLGAFIHDIGHPSGTA